MTPRVRTMKELRRRDGKRAELEGMYHRVDLRMAPEGPAADDELASAVLLSDRTVVLIEPSWSEASVRPADEVERFDGEDVVVTGTAHERSPQPEQEAAAIVSPCVSGVESIRLASEG